MSDTHELISRNEKLIAGIDALINEAYRWLAEIRKDLIDALNAENKARAKEDYPELLCCKDRVAKLCEREYLWQRTIEGHKERIRQIQESLPNE